MYSCCKNIHFSISDQMIKVISKGPTYARNNSLVLYACSSATAEIIGSLLLCPFEAVRIRSVATPTFAPNMVRAFSRMLQEEGIGGYFTRKSHSSNVLILTFQTLSWPRSAVDEATSLHSRSADSFHFVTR